MGQKAIKTQKQEAKARKKGIRSSEEAETVIEQHLNVKVSTTSSATMAVGEVNKADGSGEASRPTVRQQSHLGVDLHDAGSRVTRSRATRVSSAQNDPSVKVSQVEKAPTKNRRTQSLPPREPRQIREASKGVSKLLHRIELSTVADGSDGEYVEIDEGEYDEDPEDGESDEKVTVSDDGYEISGRKKNGYWVLTDDEDVGPATIAPSQVDGKLLNSNDMFQPSDHHHHISPKNIPQTQCQNCPVCWCTGIKDNCQSLPSKEKRYDQAKG